MGGFNIAGLLGQEMCKGPNIQQNLRTNWYDIISNKIVSVFETAHKKQTLMRENTFELPLVSDNYAMSKRVLELHLLHEIFFFQFITHSTEVRQEKNSIAGVLDCLKTVYRCSAFSKFQAAFCFSLFKYSMQVKWTWIFQTKIWWFSMEPLEFYDTFIVLLCPF